MALIPGRVGGRSERDQLLARPEPVPREAHDVVAVQASPAAFIGLPKVVIHEFAACFDVYTSSLGASIPSNWFQFVSVMKQ